MKTLIRTITISLIVSLVCSCLPQPNPQLTPEQRRWAELEVISAESEVSGITDTSVKITVNAEIAVQSVYDVKKSCSIEYYEAGQSEKERESVYTSGGFSNASYFSNKIWKSEATISNLKPDTEYNYIVIFHWKDTRRGLGKGSFKTAPTQNPTE